MAIKAANREPCTPPRSTLILTPAFVVYTELGIDPYNDVSDICHPAVVLLLLDELAIQQVLIAMTALLIQRIGTSAPDLRQKIQLSHVVQHSQWMTFN